MEHNDIDDKNWKPRRTRGTPSYHHRNRFAAAVIAAGTLLFAAWSLTPIYRVANTKLCEASFTRTEEEIDRRLLFPFPAARSKRYIEKAIADEKKHKSETT